MEVSQIRNNSSDELNKEKIPFENLDIANIPIYIATDVEIDINTCHDSNNNSGKTLNFIEDVYDYDIEACLKEMMSTYKKLLMQTSTMINQRLMIMMQSAWRKIVLLLV